MGIETKEQPQEQKPLEMMIRMLPGGQFQVSFPLMSDRVTAYGFLKLAENTLDKHYAEIDKKHIEPAKGGILNFARRK